MKKEHPVGSSMSEILIASNDNCSCTYDKCVDKGSGGMRIDKRSGDKREEVGLRRGVRGKRGGERGWEK